MHYVYLTDNVVTDQCQIDPYSVFNADYASHFIEAPDEVTFDWTYNNGSWVAPPGPTDAELKANNKEKAQQLLATTDWTATFDINNPQYSNPYLVNQDEFLAYRSALRAIAVNPPIIVDQWPTRPKEVWETV